MITPYVKLGNALANAGVPREVVLNVKGAELKFTGPVTVLVNTSMDASPYAEILIEYAASLTVPREIGMVARCMAQKKGFQAAMPWLLSLFSGFPSNGLSETNLWTIGMTIYTIDEKKYYGQVVEICGNESFGSAREMLLGTLARAKTEEAYQCLLRCLDAEGLRGHAIEALGRFGRIDAIEILETLEVQKGLYEYKARTTALRRLRRKEKSDIR